MKLIQRYEYFASGEEVDEFLDKLPWKNSTYKVIYDGEHRWALEFVGEINSVEVVYNQGY